MRTFVGVAALSYLAIMAAAHAGVTYTYDDLGRLTTAAYDNNKTITYTYDPAGNRTQVATANTPRMASIVKTSSKTKKKRKS
jgi:YD repeat-containing protein